MRKRYWVLLTCGIAVLVFGLGVAGVLIYRQVSSSAPASGEEEPRQVAELFLREAAKGDVTAACVYVVPSGGVLNPCREDLEQRPAFKALTEVSDQVQVVRAHIAGTTATVTAEDLRPDPARPLTIGLVLTDRDQMWVVRALDERPIKHEWTRDEWNQRER